MHIRDADRIRRMFDRISPTYDLLNRLFSMGSDEQWRRAAVRCLPDRGHVLDLCTGTGDLAVAAGRRGLRVVGIDFSKAMLDRAARKFPGGSFLLGDVLHLPFQDETFDAVTVGWGIRNLADPLRGLREARRVLRPGGRFVCLEFMRPKSALLRALHAGYVNGLMRVFGDAVSRSRAYSYLGGSVRRWYDAGGFSELLRACGFQSVETRALSGGLCHLYTAERAT